MDCQRGNVPRLPILYIGAAKTPVRQNCTNKRKYNPSNAKNIEKTNLHNSLEVDDQLQKNLTKPQNFSYSKTLRGLALNSLAAQQATPTSQFPRQISTANC